MPTPANHNTKPSAEPDAGCGRASKISREISPFLSPHQVCGACPDPPPPAGRQHVMPFFRGDLPEALVALVAASLPPRPPAHWFTGSLESLSARSLYLPLTSE